jgi:hypothetical protein
VGSGISKGCESILKKLQPWNQWVTRPQIEDVLAWWHKLRLLEFQQSIHQEAGWPRESGDPYGVSDLIRPFFPILENPIPS